MAELNPSNGIVLLLDRWETESEDLYNSFVAANQQISTFVIEDDGFLPEGITSIYGAFLGEYKGKKGVPGKPRYFNQIKVPGFWEIKANNQSGKIMDRSTMRGKIFYAKPAHKRLVKVVEWYDEHEHVRFSDHYNRYGALWARTVFNADGKRVNRSYFDAEGQEILVENFAVGDIILNENGRISIFRSKTDLIKHYLVSHGYQEARIFFNSLSTPFFVSEAMDRPENYAGDVLFWQEPERNDIPGHMQMILDHNTKRCNKIYVQKRNSYEKLISLGADFNILNKKGFIYDFKKENEGKPQALICTNSDEIEKLTEVVTSLPQIHFHIAAVTEMSSKLQSFENYENVTLYPGAKVAAIDVLFEKCDFYFDINHHGEIVDALRKAFIHNLLIVAFKETAHNRNYVSDKNVYAAVDVEKLLADIRTYLEDTGALAMAIKKQQRHALAENLEAYETF